MAIFFKSIRQIRKDRLHKLFFLFTLFSFIVLSSVLTVAQVKAATGINKTINFQGKLVDTNGLNVANGSYTVIFSLYTVSSGGANIWTETQSVTTTDGIFQVQLGSSTTLPGSVDFNTDNIYLGIKVGSDAEMTPRIQFTAVPYAFNAQKVAGLTVTDTTGSLTIPNSTAITFGGAFTTSGANALTLTTSGTTNATLPAGTVTLVDLAASQILSNKTIGSTGLTFSGAGTDITSAANEDLTFTPNGTGDLVLSSDFDSGVSIGSASNTPAPLSISGGIGSNASLIVNNTNSGDLFVASQAGATKFRVANNGDIVLTAGINAGGTLGSNTQCLIGGAAVAWAACSGLGTNYWQLNSGTVSPFSNTLDLLVGGTSSTSAVFKVSPNGTSPTASIAANSSYAGLVVDNKGFGDLFAASKSGASKFVITNGGNVGINGVTNPSDTLDVNGTIRATTQLNFSSASFGQIQSLAANANLNLKTAAGTGAITFAPNTVETLRLESTGLIAAGLSTATPIATLDLRARSGTLAIASVSGISSFAAMIVDNNGVGDLFSASKSGATKFSILNNGNVRINNLNAASCDVKADTTGLLSCGTDAGGGATTNYWDLQNGALLSGNTTLDLLLGGTSTSSAKFAFINNSGSGEPTASIAGSITLRNGTGLINRLNGGSINMQTSVGGDSGLSTKLYIANNGNIGLGTNNTNPLGTLDVRGISGTSAVASLSGTTSQSALTVDQLGAGDLFTASRGGMTKFVINNAGRVGIGTSGTLTSYLDIGNTNDGGTLTGINIKSPLTTGIGLIADTSGMTSGSGINVSGNTSGTLSPYTGQLFSGVQIRTHSGATTITDTGKLLQLSRANTNSNAGGIFNVTGDLATLASNCNVSAGSCNDSASILSLSQSYANATGPVMKILSQSTAATGLYMGRSAQTGGNLGFMDIRSPLGTVPAASFSAQTAFAAMIVNNSGSGDIFTASSSGLNRFVIKQNGAVGIGTDLPTSDKLQVAATTDLQADLVQIGNTSALASTGNGANGLQIDWFGKPATGNVNSAQRINVTNGNTTTAGQVQALRLTATGAGGSVNSDTVGLLIDGLTNASRGTTGQNAIEFGSNWDNSLFGQGDLRINANGNIIFATSSASTKIGINTTAPLATLDVRGNSASTPVASVAGSTNLAAMVVNNSGNGDLFTASKSGATKFVITNAGNVGIGTNTPTDALNVEGGNITIGQQTNTTQSSEQAWTKVTQATGTISAAGGSTTSIASVSASVVYNGSLYVGTTKLNGAEVYRYDGPTLNTWTKVSSATAGTIKTGGTANIDGVSAMIVWNGFLYIGTRENANAEMYRMDSSGNWNVVNTIKGTFVGATTKIDAVSALAINNGSMYVGISKPLSASVYRYDGGVNGLDSWLSAAGGTAGTIQGGTTTNIDAVTALVSYHGNIYAATSKGAGGAEIYMYKDASSWTPIMGAGAAQCATAAAGRFCNNGTAFTSIQSITQMTVFQDKLFVAMRKSLLGDLVYFEDITSSYGTPDNAFTRIIDSPGIIQTGGTSAINSIASMAVYNGKLYIGTDKSNAAEIYRYEGGVSITAGNNSALWTKVSQATAGTISSGGATSMDFANVLIPFGNSLYGMAYDPVNGVEGYKYTVVSGQSYALQFHAGLTGEQNSLQNLATISFIASSSAAMGVGGTSGSFLFSHQIMTQTGAYDVAEDYASRDDTLQPGDIVAVDPYEDNMVKKASGSADSVVGIYSENPGFRLSQSDTMINGGKAVPVALAGRVSVKFSSKNGTIKNGDLVTASDIPGVAMKATKAGFIIGRALESYSDTDPDAIGKVMIFINLSWYDPQVVLTDTGNMSVNGNLLSTDSLHAATGAYTLGALDLSSTPAEGFALASNEAKAQTDLELLATLIQKQQSASASSVLSQVTADRVVAGLSIVSPHVVADTVRVNAIQSATGKDIGVQLSDDGTFSVRNASGEAGITFTANGDAHFAGTITADKIRINEVEITSEAWAQAFKDGGLSLVESILNEQDARLTNLESLFASASAQVTPAPVATMTALLTTLPEIVEEQTTVSEASDSGKMTIDSLRVTGSALIEGMLHVVDFLTARNLIVDQLATFLGKAVFSGDVIFEGRPTFNKDTAGIALVKKGTDRVEVRFEKAYDTAPMVNVNLTLDDVSPMPGEELENLTRRQEAQEEQVFKANVRYVITKRTAKGFVILLDKKADDDTTFSWIVVAVDKPVVHTGNGDNITTISTQSDENARPISSSTKVIIPTSSNESSRVISVVDTPMPTGFGGEGGE